ncbi:MAG: glycosyltransferase family 9 protein [Planctomycetota bacterium]
MRILVARLSAMGDVVHGIPAVRALCDALPSSQVFWVVQREFIPLLEHAGLPLTGILPFDRRGGPLAYWRCMRAVRRLGVQVALDLQGNWKSAGLCRASGAVRRLGIRAELRRESSSAVLLSEQIPSRGDSRHPADVAWALVNAVAPSATGTSAPCLHATAPAMAAESAAVRALGIEPTRPFTVIVLGHSADPRSLRPSSVLAAAAHGGGQVLGLLGPADGAVGDRMSLPVLQHGRGELSRLVALGAIVAEARGHVVGPDKGATHVLGAAGATVWMVHGPTDPARTTARSAIVIQRDQPPACMPCDRRECHHPMGPVCMELDERVFERAIRDCTGPRQAPGDDSP